MKHIQDEEVDFFELFQKLWKSKLLITAFMSIAFLLGSIFLLNKDNAYQSSIPSSFNNIPPFLDNARVSTDFKEKLFSKNTFENWKKNYGNTLLKFDDINPVKTVNGYLFSKLEGESLITLKIAKKSRKDTSLLITLNIYTNNFPVINDFFKYVNYTNDILKNDYVLMANNEISSLKIDFAEHISTLLSVNRYKVDAENGANPLSFQRPTMPINTSIKPHIILILSVILGGILGVIFVFIKNAISARQL
jgi:hypothetical protein